MKYKRIKTLIRKATNPNHHLPSPLITESQCLEMINREYRSIYRAIDLLKQSKPLCGLAPTMEDRQQAMVYYKCAINDVLDLLAKRKGGKP